MRIAVFGATGGAGGQIVGQSLAAGDQVVAYVRDPARLASRHELLTVVKGELSDCPAIERAVRGADAVISVLGPRGDHRAKPLTLGMLNILTAMRRCGVSRLIVSSGAAFRDPKDRLDLKFDLLVALLKLTIRDGLADFMGLCEEVRASDRDWTIVRVPPLRDGAKSGSVRVGYPGQGVVQMHLVRADMADFMLRQARDLRYLRQAPMISN